MRLRSGAQVGEGRVEVLRNRRWGTVCDHGWNLISASVVCRQLGFGSAREALFGAQLGQGERGGLGWGGRAWMCHRSTLWWSWGARAQAGSPLLWRGSRRCGVAEMDLPWPLSLPSAALGPIHLSEVRCGGYERTLSDCPSLEGSQSGCQHDNDAAVRCNIPNLGFQDQVSPELAWDTAWSQWGAVHESLPGASLECPLLWESPLAWTTSPQGQVLAFRVVRISVGLFRCMGSATPPSQVPCEAERDGA